MKKTYSRPTAVAMDLVAENAIMAYSTGKRTDAQWSNEKELETDCTRPIWDDDSEQ